MSSNLKIATLIAQYGLGLIYFIFGANGFVHLVPIPPLPDPASDLMHAFFESGYLFTLIKVTEVIFGFLLIIRKFVPLALVVLAPVTLNILLFHLILAPDGSPFAISITALHLFLGYSYRSAFRPMFQL